MLEYTNKRVLLSICRKWKWTALAIHKPLTICSMFCMLRALLHTQVLEWTSCCLLPLLVNNCGLSNCIYEWYKDEASTDIYCCGSSSYFPTHVFIAIITSHRMRCLPFIYGEGASMGEEILLHYSTLYKFYLKQWYWRILLPWIFGYILLSEVAL